MPSAKPRSRNRRPSSSRQKVQAHRDRLRAQGLRPIQIWVPDTRSPRFAAQAARQSRLVASSRHAAEDQAFVDALASED
ncbi:MAG TPA: antitoxin MazE family protein [Candidatus Eisenbacteria bacterium]|nr:antitoxin MazE family protein [Candidatus Eisenbacteria bacterium]